MDTQDILFAGIDFSSGRQPVTFVVLDDRLNVACLEKMELESAVAYLKDAGQVTLAVNVSTTKTFRAMYSTFPKKIASIGLKPFAKSARKQFFETNAQDCFRAFIGKAPLPRRTFEGRVQRALMLYEQGVHLNDPMDFFEEITRHHMLNGVFPNELLYSSIELDALAAAYVAWLAVNETGQVEIMGNDLILPKEADTD